MKKVFYILFILLLFICPQKIFAAGIDDTVIQQQLDIYHFDDMNSTLQQKLSQNVNLDFQDLIAKAMKGELDLNMSTLIKNGLKLLFQELYLNGALIRNMLVIAILSAFLKNLTASFQHQEIGELGFYVSYIVLIIVIFNSFQIALEIMGTLVGDLATVMEGMLPFVMSLLFMSGQVSSAFVFNPILIMVIQIVTRMIRDVIAPFVTLVAVMQIVNFLSVKEILTKMTEQLRKGIGLALKGIGILFVTILSLQKISAPIVNNFVTKTAKISMSAIPVVGDVLTGAVDTVLYWTQAVKSGFLVAVLVVIILICILPVIKLVALIIVYKLTASIIQPICDERIVDCIDSIGSLTVLLLGAAVTVIVMFVFYMMITLSF